MYAGSLESTRYLLPTEFEGRSARYGPSFFRSDLWPKSSRKNQVSTYSNSYVINQQNFLRYLHLALKGDARWTKSV